MPVLFDRADPSDEARPRVVANMVAGLDGSASVGGRAGPLSGPADRTRFVAFRAEADVVLVGAGTVRAEGYGPVRLDDRQRATRLAEGRTAAPPIAVVSRSLRLDWNAPLFAPGGHPRPLILTCDAAHAAARAEAEHHADVLVIGGATVDLEAALGELRARGHARVLTEGGPALLGELLTLGLLDELRLTLAPLLGGDPLPITRPFAETGSLTAFDLTQVEEEDGHLFLRYRIRREAT